ncbi:MAG: hypothetical protein GTN71_05730, partial [Anaerolineae bacterium]|nr:hypothetical protein [Anaerolineae bacterium]
MGSGTKTPVETVDHMRQVYAETGSCAKVAEICGVSEPTARKFAMRGDLSRGILPFAADAIVANLQQSETITTVRYTDEEIEANGMFQLRLIDRLIALAAAALEQSLTGKNGKRSQGSLRLTDLCKAAQIRSQLVSAYCGRSEMSRTTTMSQSTDDPFASIPPEHVEAASDYYLEHNRLPTDA